MEFASDRYDASSAAGYDANLDANSNLCVATMLEAVRDRVRSVDLKQVNRVLMQPHWRREQDVL